MTTAKLLRVAALGFLAAANIIPRASGQLPPELGDIKLEIPGTWSELPPKSDIKLPELAADSKKVNEKVAIYRAIEPKADGVGLSIVWKSGFEKGGHLDTTWLTDREIGATVGVNLADDGMHMSQLRLPKVKGEGPEFQVTFNNVTNAAGAPALFVSTEYFLDPSKNQETACLTLYCPGNKEGALAARDFLDKLTIQGREIGRTIQMEKAWTDYFEPLRSGEAATVATSAGAPLEARPRPYTPESQEDFGDLVQKNQNSLVLFEGSLGAGSGFVARSGDTDMVFTNIHVAAADQGLKLRTMTGAKVAVGVAEAAVDHDVLRFRLPEGTSNYSTLELMADVTAEAKVNDRVAVLGNSEGAGVVQALPGKIIGIGPDRVEIDAPFIPGNSGSPIIHIPTGKVIGIATYIMIHDTSFDDNGRRTSSGSGQRSFRRFAYRIDTVKTWQPVNWPVFYKQAAELKRSEELTKNVFALMKDIADNDDKIDIGAHTDPALRSAVSEFARLASTTERMSESDIKSVVGRVFSGLRSVCKTELGPPTPQGYYDFFWDGFQEEKQVRSKLVEGFDRTLKRVGR